jgi:hypothetical protein
MWVLTFAEHRRTEKPKRPSVAMVITTLKKKKRKLLDLYYGDQIDSDTFVVEHRDLTTKMKTLQKETDDSARDEKTRIEAADKFDEIADLLSNMNFEQLWSTPTLAEQRVLVLVMVDSVYIYPYQLTVQRWSTALHRRT